MVQAVCQALAGSDAKAEFQSQGMAGANFNVVHWHPGQLIKGQLRALVLCLRPFQQQMLSSSGPCTPVGPPEHATRAHLPTLHRALPAGFVQMTAASLTSVAWRIIASVKAFVTASMGVQVFTAGRSPGAECCAPLHRASQGAGAGFNFRAGNGSAAVLGSELADPSAAGACWPGWCTMLVACHHAVTACKNFQVRCQPAPAASEIAHALAPGGAAPKVRAFMKAGMVAAGFAGGQGPGADGVAAACGWHGHAACL